MTKQGKPQGESFLGKDTPGLFDQVLAQIQAGERRFGSVESRDHEKRLANQSENLLENGASAHPKFADKQRFDGDDPNVTPNPVNNPEAYQELQNELKAKQQLQQQLANSKSNTFNPKPTMGG